MGRGGAVQSGRQERGMMELRKEEREKALSGNAAWRFCLQVPPALPCTLKTYCGVWSIGSPLAPATHDVSDHGCEKPGPQTDFL